MIPHSLIRLFRMHLLWFVVFLPAGCASAPQPEPFAEFSSAAGALRQGTYEALEASRAAEAEQFLQEGVADEEFQDAIERLRFEVTPDDPFAWSNDALPVMFVAERFRDGANRLAVAFEEYASLLHQLASLEVASAGAFDNLRAELNANVSSGITAVTGQPPSPAGLALFSTVAAEAARLFIEKKRKGDLVRAVRDNQTAVQAVSDAFVNAIRTTAVSAWAQYGNAFQQVARRAPAATNQADRRAVLERLIALDRDHIARIRTLQRMQEAYAAIPAAHFALAEAADGSGSALDAIGSLSANAQRLGGAYRKLLKGNRVTTAAAVAERAVARAELAKTRAEAAQNAADEAVAAHSQASAALEQDRENSQLAADVQRSAEQVEQLREVAARLKEAAAAAQAAAEDTQRLLHDAQQAAEESS